MSDESQRMRPHTTVIGGYPCVYVTMRFVKEHIFRTHISKFMIQYLCQVELLGSAGLGLCILIGLPVGWAALFHPLLEKTQELDARETELQGEVKRLEDRLAELKDYQARLESDPRFVEKIAREDLGFAKPGETIFRIAEEPTP